MSLTTFLQQCLTGISLGGAYALIATGYTLTYGILRPINFAHGDIFMMTGYFMIFATAGLPWFTAVPVTLVVTVPLDVTIERVVYRPLRSVPKISVTISVTDVSYFLQNLATYLFTALPRGYLEVLFLKRIYRTGGLPASFVIFFMPILIPVLVCLFILPINHTKIGMVMKAASKDHETASLMSIKIDKIITLIFAAGSLPAGTGPILYLADRMTVFPFSGALPGLERFVVAVFGGIGSTPGAVTGGFILGLGETAPVAMGQSTFSDVFTFILLIIILLTRPTGLFGEKTTDKA